MVRFFKYFFFLVVISLLCVLGWCFYVYQSVRFATPPLSEIAKNIDPFAASLAFNYSKNIDKQLYLFSKNIGLEKNPLNQQAPPKEGDLGANGFLILDVRPQESRPLFQKLDVLLNTTLDFLEESNEDAHLEKQVSLQETEEESLQNPLVNPLASFLQELGNGKTFVIAGATNFYLSFEDSLALAFEPYFKNYISVNPNAFRKMIIKNSPLFIQELLNKHFISLEIEPLLLQKEAAIHESKISFSLDNSRQFLDSVCAAEINPWDACGRLSFDRKKFRKNAESLFGLLEPEFKVTFHIYWAVRGKDILYSNNSDMLVNLLNPRKKNSAKNILTAVSGSGDDLLFSKIGNLKYSSLAVSFDMIKSQNEAINFFENMKHQSHVMANYFATPRGELVFFKIEKLITDLTHFSQQTSLAFQSDGERLLPELRLYSPSGDLFVKDGKELSPQVINTLRVAVTKAISFGNYVLPRGLLPLPGPYLKRNGRWVILKSDINIKSMAPYLESTDPYIDQFNLPSTL